VKKSARADNRGIFASLLLLYHLCHTDSPFAYHTALTSLTQPRIRALREPFKEIGNQLSAPPDAFLHPLSPALRTARRLRVILSQERFDPITYWHMFEDPDVSALEKAIIGWSSGRVRECAWDIVRKAYLEVSVDWVGLWLGLSPPEIEEWVRKKGHTIEKGRIKFR
jgi:hypothetical protein